MDSDWIEDYTEFEKDIELHTIVPEGSFICCYPRTHTDKHHPDKEFYPIEWVFAGAEYVKETKQNNRKPKTKSHRKRTRNESE